MEKWEEVFENQIPHDIYSVRLVNGEDNGLSIELTGIHHKVLIWFGNVHSIRMIDEGIVQKDLYSDSEIERFKNNGFRNKIYEIENGEFYLRMKHFADGYLEGVDLKHYIIVTQNYNIEVLTEFEPTITLIR